jgi:hypothetical protein
VGSRATPADALARIEVLAGRLARAGLTLRTGASPGADQAFASGAARAGGSVELYLPWPSFEAEFLARTRGANRFVLAEPNPRAFELAARLHPRWGELGEDERSLRARDVHEVLGANLSSPAAFVVCWTPDGSIDGSSESAGGTGQALRTATSEGVPVVNLARGADAWRSLEDVLARAGLRF